MKNFTSNHVPTSTTAVRHAARIALMRSLAGGWVVLRPVRTLAAKPQPHAAASCNEMHTAMAAGWDGGVAESVIDPRDAGPLASQFPLVRLGQGDQQRDILPSDVLNYRLF